MKHLIAFTICIALICTVSGFLLSTTRLNSKDYFIYGGNPLNWFEAENFCNSIKMQLLTIESAKENNALQDYLTKTDQLNTIYWTAGKAIPKTRSFAWSTTGKPFEYTNWGKNEPNNLGKGEDCVHTTSTFQWNDKKCNVKYHFICEAKVRYPLPVS